MSYRPYQDNCLTCSAPMSSKGPGAYCSMCHPPRTPEQKQAVNTINPIMDRVDAGEDSRSISKK
jgi:hypothetical protein